MRAKRHEIFFKRWYIYILFILYYRKKVTGKEKNCIFVRWGILKLWHIIFILILTVSWWIPKPSAYIFFNSLIHKWWEIKADVQFLQKITISKNSTILEVIIRCGVWFPIKYKKLLIQFDRCCLSSWINYISTILDLSFITYLFFSQPDFYSKASIVPIKTTQMIQFLSIFL